MTRRKWAAGLVPAAVIAIAAAGCGGDGGGGGGYNNDTRPAAGTAPAAKTSAATVAARRVGLGTVLVNGSGRTLYLFEKDKGGTSACDGACTSAWPPVTTGGAPVAGPGIDATKLGTTKRGDGTTEVTYAGHPLYLYAGDAKPGDTSGEGLDQFGAEWYVLGRTGRKIEDEG